MNIPAALAASLLLTGAPVLAQAPPPPATTAPTKTGTPAPPARPAPDLDAGFKFVDGTWKCDTRFAPNAFGPGSPEMTTKSTVKFKRDYDGYFYRGEYEIRKSRSMPGFRATLFIGYQPAAHVFTVTSVDSSGFTELATSPGFEGETITFSGQAYMGGRTVKVRESMTRRGAKEIGHKLEAEIDPGKGLQVIGEDSCKR
jgi:hypothetical protein